MPDDFYENARAVALSAVVKIKSPPNGNPLLLVYSSPLSLGPSERPPFIGFGRRDLGLGRAFILDYLLIFEDDIGVFVKKAFVAVYGPHAVRN